MWGKYPDTASGRWEQPPEPSQGAGNSKRFSLIWEMGIKEEKDVATMEIVVGTYEELILGYKIKTTSEKVLDSVTSKFKWRDANANA